MMRSKNQKTRNLALSTVESRFEKALAALSESLTSLELAVPALALQVQAAEKDGKLRKYKGPRKGARKRRR